MRLELPSRLEVLDKAGELVRQLAEAAGFEEDSRLDIQTAVHESVVNAIVHGNGLDISVRDEGQGFDPSRLPDPLAPENLCRTSGRGVLLMKVLMDTVAFRRPANGGMEVTMRKRLWDDLGGNHHLSPTGAVV